MADGSIGVDVNRAVVFKAQSLGQQQQHHLKNCETCSLPSPTSEPLNQMLWLSTSPAKDKNKAGHQCPPCQQAPPQQRFLISVNKSAMGLPIPLWKQPHHCWRAVKKFIIKENKNHFPPAVTVVKRKTMEQIQFGTAVLPPPLLGHSAPPRGTY